MHVLITMWRIRMLVLFMYLRQNSHRYSLGSLQDRKMSSFEKNKLQANVASKLEGNNHP